MVTKSGWVVFEEDFGVTRYGSKAEELCVVVSHAYVFEEAAIELYEMLGNGCRLHKALRLTRATVTWLTQEVTIFGISILHPAYPATNLRARRMPT